MAALAAVLAMRAAFPAEVLSAAMNQLVQRKPLPPLFMRFLMQVPYSSPPRPPCLSALAHSHACCVMLSPPCALAGAGCATLPLDMPWAFFSPPLSCQFAVKLLASPLEGLHREGSQRRSMMPRTTEVSAVSVHHGALRAAR